MLDILEVKFDQFLDIIDFSFVVQLVLVLLWLLAVKKFHLSFKVSLVIALVLIVISAFVYFFNLNLAEVFGEYSFILIVIAAVQIIKKQ